MGGCVPCTDNQPKKPLHQQELIITKAVQIDQHLNPQYFILLTQYDNYHANYESTLKQTFPSLKIFKNKQELQAYRQDDKNNILIICCKDINEVKEARKFSNFHTFTKIAVAYNFDIPSLQEVRVSLQKSMGFRFRDIFRDGVNQIKKFFQRCNQQQSLYFCHSNMGMVNRSLLIFHYFFRGNYQNKKENFLNWLDAKKGGDLVARIQSGQNHQKWLVENLLSENQFLKQAVDLLRTQNPGVIANVSWLAQLVFKFIRREYEKTLKNLKETEFVVWIELTKKQIQIFENSQGENFMFSTFMVGYTNASYIPQKASRSENMYRIYINIPKDINKFDRQVDLGFYIHQNKVIFNLFNMYRVDSVLLQDKSISVTYSSIGIENNLRSSEFRYSKDAKKGDIRMMKLYDYYCLNRTQVKNELDLVYALQMYEKYKVIAFIRTTNLKSGSSTELASTQATSSILDASQNKFNQYLGDCQFQSRNYSLAISYYDSIRPNSQRGLLKKLYLYSYTSNGPKFRQTIEQLKKLQQTRPAKHYNRFTKMAFNNFVAMMCCRSGDYEQASKKIHETLSEMSKTIELYKFYNESYASFPLYYLLQRTAASICRYKGEVRQAEAIEKQCETNELLFDGVHRIWLQKQS